MSLLDNLTLDDLDEEQRQLAECIGLDSYKKLIATYAGSCLFIRMPERITLNLRNAEIKSKFNGYNYGDLAREYNLTEISIRKIVSNEIAKAKTTPMENQMSLFEAAENKCK